MIKSKIVKVTRLMCGRGCGEYGVACYDSNLYGMPLDDVLGEPLWEGAKVRVTVELLKQGRKRKNPWLRK